MSSSPDGARKRPRTDGPTSRWRHVRALSKFIKLSVDVQRLPRGSVPPDDELASLALGVFRKYDKDQNGTLDLGEFKYMLLDLGVSHANLHKNVVEQYISTIDLNRDRAMCFDEFLIAYKALIGWDRERATLRAPFKCGSAASSPQRLLPDSPLDSCPRSHAPAVLVGDVPFAVCERYKLERLIGRGAYGVVAAASDGVTGERVVVKRVAAVGHPVELQATMRELVILRHIRRHPHENLIGLLDMTPPPAGSLDAWDALFLILPRMDCDLHAIIRSNQPLSDDHCQFFAYQLLRGLFALHSAGVVHRDLKPSNLLVNKDCTLRIADFGISRTLGETESALSVLDTDRACEGRRVRPLTNYVVTRYYRAPELLLECVHYTRAVDVWSVGAIIAEMALRRPLLCGTSATHQLELIGDMLGAPSAAERAALLDMHGASAQQLRLLAAAGERTAGERTVGSAGSRVAAVLAANSTFGNADNGSIDLVAQMLRYTPADRMDVPAALEHAWLREMHECNEEPRLPPVMMPSYPGRGVSRKHLQLLAIESVRELHAAPLAPPAPSERGVAA
ncbi:hypothetical protein KFE25_008619 [Diacronema lutheri]|uniref:Mitogen-activated protein kinase n=1 Tax=Diacronema lutheri TaxID=2081491 RepID=A0A8J6CJQ5_DIALT|nr:hypothetical protein KFE25_008619 [Diacronema lutheri]